LNGNLTQPSPADPAILSPFAVEQMLNVVREYSSRSLETEDCMGRVDSSTTSTETPKLSPFFLPHVSAATEFRASQFIYYVHDLPLVCKLQRLQGTCSYRIRVDRHRCDRRFNALILGITMHIGSRIGCDAHVKVGTGMDGVIERSRKFIKIVSLLDQRTEFTMTWRKEIGRQDLT
jgi:hypothetical protein